MTYTTNYSLHKPDTTDNFNISDFNANSDIIDKQFGITSANIPKVTCSTGASTVAKTATINGTFVLNRGARVLVTLSTTNTVASATFNLNSTGAKAILVNGASVTASNLTAQTYLAEYDGTNWRFTTSTYTSDYARVANSASSATNATYSSYLGTSSANYTKANLDSAIKSITRNGTTFTLTKMNGTTSTVTQQDSNTTYSFAGGTNKFTVTPSGGTAQDVSVTPSWTITADNGNDIDTVGTPSVTATTTGTTTKFTFHKLKGATGTTPTIKAVAGANIGSVGTPSVTATTTGTTTKFTFNYLKGEKGDKGSASVTSHTLFL